MARNLKRWAAMNKVFLVALLMIVVFAWMDAKQIITFHTLNSDEAWELYNTYTGPAIWMLWGVVLIALGVTWFIYSRDKSEAIALSGASLILMASGLEDVLFFAFLQERMGMCMAWFNSNPYITQSFASRFILSEDCVSPLGLYLNVAIGIVLAYFFYKWMREKL